MLELNGIALHLDTFALNNITFSVNKGDYYVLLGESGAGKSLILEVIAGLISPDNGSIYLNGKDITHEKINRRSIGLVFQDHAVFPHMSVRQNIAYSLRGKNMTARQKEDIILGTTDNLNITGLLNRHPGTLSGGELQRVALARTLVQKPEILLLDEPLASIDVKLKSDLRSLLRSLNASGQTIVHVTHDYTEAVSLANRIAVLHQGTILQEGSPALVFTKPISQFIAQLSGVNNFFKVKAISSDPPTLLINEKLTLKVSPAFINRPDSDIDSGNLIIPESAISFHTEIHNNDLPENTPFQPDRQMQSGTGLSLSKDYPYNNLFEGTITEIINKVFTVEVKVNIGIELKANIPGKLAEELQLHEGQHVIINIKL